MNTIKVSNNKNYPFIKQLKEIVDHIVKTSDTDIILDPDFIAIDYFSRINKYKDIYSKLIENYSFKELFSLFSTLFYNSTNELIKNIINKNNPFESRDYVNATYLQTRREQQNDNSLLMIEIDSYIAYKSNLTK